VLPDIDEVARDPSLDLLDDVVGHADVARIGDAFETGGHVHAVPENVAAIEDYVADIDADAKVDPRFLRNLGVSLGHASLDIHRTTHRVHGAAEFGQQPISRVLDDTPTVLCDFRIYEGGQMLSELKMRSLFIKASQTTISCDIGRQNGSEPPL
jgi:hypothetical protein